MIPAAFMPTVRAAILRLLLGLGEREEQSDDALFLQLVQLRHPISRREVAAQLRWLGEAGLLETYDLGPYLMARLLPDGADVANNRLRVDGVEYRADRVGTARL